MPELLIEFLTEEIPARMQARAAEDLCRLAKAALAPLIQGEPRGFHGPRRIGLVAGMALSAETPAKEERGPRIGAPEQALAGFLKKHNAAREMLAEQNGFLVLMKPGEIITAEALLARALPEIVWSFPWPKSMRWANSALAWVRPLQRVLCLLDGKVVPVAFARGEDAAHGLVAADLTEGHRVHAPGAFAVTGFADYTEKLRAHFVVPEAEERITLIRDGVAALAAAEGIEVVPDEGLLAEVAGLVEWPVPLLGRIDDAFMDLPAEVMRTSMRVNQRYFALRRPDGSAAPYFALVANIAATDGGKALVAGNERVLRARLSDARFFWDQDRKQKLEEFLPKLDGVVFHAKLGTQGQRVLRIAKLAAFLAHMVGADAPLAERAARLAKADLVSGMVGEFPELQGVMGGYYARQQGEDPRVADAIAQHYRPLGPTDAVPTEPVAIALALADKLDQLAGFFAADERPTGSGDPFALRRAALGVIRILRENGLRLRPADIVGEAFFGFPQATGSTASPKFGMAVAQERIKAGAPKESRHPPMVAAFAAGVVDFLTDRLRVQLRAEGARHDLVAASIGEDDDILRILSRAEALKSLVESEDGKNLLAAYKRAQNILRIEEKKDGPHSGPVDEALLALPEEKALNTALASAEAQVQPLLASESFGPAMSALAALRPPVDAFFDRIMVNDPEPSLRRNRLRLLSRLRTAMDAVGDLSKIEA
ncbi:glycine--tRNA ligase subunit beta [Roseococcus sp. SYP-B2431]|uniref:glycine--tRNA ligase subunit beta n=1 Tax=Roseococcus sp. SYP-B2431 TaxID=2496640 RepID=UPI00103D8E54|nr:glycine--tRNA ligase subunit beta [Roseococcus sp. SYP-B2431]TCH97454.1 glycine--tRNA ligase subunit beta [Roseococcus sp. SYP-B2431]